MCMHGLAGHSVVHIISTGVRKLEFSQMLMVKNRAKP